VPTYTPNIPQPGDIPAQSQDQILQNFQSIDNGTDGFSLNHISFTNATVGERGKHKFLQMPEQAAAPVTAVNEGAVYTKEASDPALGLSTELFWRRESNGAEIRLTGVTTAAAKGRTYLANGLMLQWGLEIAVANGAPISFDQAFSAPVLKTFLNPYLFFWAFVGSKNCLPFRSSTVSY